MSATTPETFLSDVDATEISWARPAGAPSALKTDLVWIGPGKDGLEVAVARTAPHAPAPKVDEVRRLWNLRWNKRAAPVVLVVEHEDGGVYKAWVCGTKDDPAVIPDLDLSQVERICAAALAAPDPANAERTLHRLLISQKDELVAGLTNVGLFASYELRTGVPARSDWATARDKAVPLLTARGSDLFSGLGYTLTPHGSTAMILTANGTHRAVAVLLEDHEMFDRPIVRLGAASPIQLGLQIAQTQGLPWLLVTRGTQLRLYPTSPDVGVGRKGPAETFTEVDLALLAESDAAYLSLIFSADALTAAGSVVEILDASADHAAGLGARLRERVYAKVVPALAVAVANQMGAATEDDLTEAYHRTLTILFRLLFVSYAEDRGLLPYQRNPRYTKKALKTLARELAADPNLIFDGEATDRWEDLLAVWKAVDDGNKEWGVPAYDGGLFAADSAHPSGQAIAAMSLTNVEIGDALRDMLIDTGDDGTTGPVDFRSLSVREFGTIYEGLLESSLSIAPSDLAVDAKTREYRPAAQGDEIEVHAGQVYFHNASGARKATGSYFTKKFAVEHLLDATLEPALAYHLAEVQDLLDRGDEAKAAEKFFDFRVADLAMGSGHFLVGAIDRIENRFSAFLTAHPIPDVTAELSRLAEAARTALGDGNSDIEIEPSALLRRQVARRCVYGVDLNLMAVELARLGIWIHTFVPGLPMSALDHGLVVGNSLTGIGTIDEVIDVLEPERSPGQYSLFSQQIEDALVTAKERLLRTARTSEATKAEVHQAARAHAEAMEDAVEAKALLDAAIGVRLGIITLPAGPSDAMTAGNSAAVQNKIAELQAAHLPYLFPEVFLRDRPGFDVILGNPPWDEVMIEEPKFWQRHSPGVMGLKPADQKRRIAQLRSSRPDLVTDLEAEQQRMADIRDVLITGPYPGLGTGDIDYYKAFSWRDWNTLRDGGRMGAVFPRSLLNAAGSAPWRAQVLTRGQITSAATLTNTGKWVFDDVDGRYTVVLLSLVKARPSENAQVGMVGPFHSLTDFSRGAAAIGYLPVSTLVEWGNGAAFPLLPDAKATEVFAKYRRSPRFDAPGGDWEYKPVAEFHATNDRKTFDAGGYHEGRWPVLTGASFNLWDPDAGEPYTWATQTKVVAALQAKRKRQARTSSSAFYGLSTSQTVHPETLACMFPRIAVRDVARSTDTRTVLAALVPPNAVLTNAAPYLLRRKGNAADEAFLLGVLCSIPLDWYARRYVELHVNNHVLNAFPIPRPTPDSPLRTRVVQIAGRLAAVDSRFAAWAKEVGVPVGSVPDTDKGDLIDELDAVVAHLYGLNERDVEHVFETFHRGWNFKPRLSAVLTHFEAWKAQVRA